MTCQDCLFYDFCNEYNEYPEYVQHCKQTTGTEFKCSHFKEKYRFVELPCKVGDTVFEVSAQHLPPFIQESTVEKIIITSKGLRIKLSRNSVYETSISALGKSIFFTREKADKALNERNEK